MDNYNLFLKNQLDLVNNHQVNLTEEDILNFLKITNRWPVHTIRNIPTVEIINQWGKTVSEFFNASGKFLFDEWKKYYDRGFTTILSDILDLSEELRSLDQKLCDSCGKKIHANFYFSKGSENCSRVSLEHHSHEYDVIVKMIYGKSLWKLNDEYFEVQDESIIIPAGTMHSVVQCTDKKLSLTINMV